LPAMARQLVPDPLIFGWCWPLFGLATAVAPLAVAAWTRFLGNRRLWMTSHLVMAAGVALPVFWPGIAGIMLAAMLIGGTFMLNAMASMQEARRVGGAQATRLMAAMTAAFATGQIVGPLAIAYGIDAAGGFAAPLLAASFLLVAGA